MPAHSGWCLAHDPYFAITVCPRRLAAECASVCCDTCASAFACRRLHYAVGPRGPHVHAPRVIAAAGAVSFYQALALAPAHAGAGANLPGMSRAEPNASGASAAAANADDSTSPPAELDFFGLFSDVLVPEEHDRALALERVVERLTTAAREYAQESPSAASATSTPSASAQLLNAHLPSVLRLSLACPLPDITSSMKQLLHTLASIVPAFSKYVLALDFAFQPSSFVPLSSCVDPTGQAAYAPVPAAVTDDDACAATAPLLEDIFLSAGRISHADLLMAWHPSFLTDYTTSSHFIMDDAGPVPPTWRNYIAIMAASRHHCDYLVSLQETEFLLKGGDPQWLKGIAHAPKKLQSLCDLNALLAHQPWLLTKAHIAALVHNAGTDSWSVAELVHALVILTTYHALCGFVYGMGLQKEIDAHDWANWDPAKTPTPAPTVATAAAPHASAQPPAAVAVVAAAQHTAASGVSDGEHLLRLLSSDVGDRDDLAATSNAFNSAAEEQLGTSPMHAGDTTHSRAPSTGFGARSSHEHDSPHSAMAGLGAGMRALHMDAHPSSKYLVVLPESVTSPASAAASSASKIATMRYSNFDVNSKAYSIFFLHEFTWKQSGYALVNRFYQGFAQMLDAEWDGIFSLTYNTVSDKQNVDTTPFRRAIWYFAQRLYGLQHDDYNYNKIPIFLTVGLKTFVRKIACAPETITQTDYELPGYNFQPSEKCHIVLLAIEARRQASLLYALHAVMQYMNAPQ